MGDWTAVASQDAAAVSLMERLRAPRLYSPNKI
jgi:hypothetical protein